MFILKYTVAQIYYSINIFGRFFVENVDNIDSADNQNGEFLRLIEPSNIMSGLFFFLRGCLKSSGGFAE